MKRKSKKLFSGFLLSLGILISLFIVSAVVLRSDTLKVDDINIYGENKNLHENIVKTIEKEISGKYFSIFPKNNYLLFPKNKIENIIYESFKEIKKVSFDFNNFKELILNIDVRKPFGLFCSNEKDCYFLDESGFIYARSPSFSSNVFFKYYKELDNEIIGSNFLDNEDFKKMSFFLKSVKEELGLDPISLTEKNDEYFINLEDKINEYGFYGGDIVFNKSENLGDVFNRLSAILKQDGIKQDIENEEEKTELDYIDLRFGNKVYYKFK